MTTHAISRRDDGTIEFTVTVPWAQVSKIYEGVVEDLVKSAELPGFRKGKAPRKMVEEKLDKTNVYEQVIRKLLPQVYNDVVTKEKLKPIISPKVELKEAKEGADWILIIYTVEKPEVTLGDYKKAIREGKNEKQKKIWVPGKDEKPEEKTDEKVSLDQVLGWTLTAISMKVPDLLLEQEVNKLLSNLIDQTKTLGLSVEQYLSATGRNSETVRKEYEEQSRRTIMLDFGIEEIADKEGILVSDDDIDKVVKSGKTEDEKKQLEGQRYYIASVLRRQKTLDYLASL